MKTIVYIDGFNLYYGAVKGTPHKWLDLDCMCRLLLPKNQIIKIKYFTARIVPRPGHPGQQARQNTYLRALRTLPNVEIIFGSFLVKTRQAMLADSNPNSPQYVRVLRTEEKGSDVNLATHLVSDGYKGAYEVAAVVTNDSDLLEPIKLVRYELNLPVGIINPHKQPSQRLVKYGSFFRQIRKGVLAASQFPNTLQDANGVLRRPASW